MNFLSHYYHEWPCDDPYFAAGLVLPDILSNFSYRNGRVVKLHPWRMAEPGNAVQASLTAGVKQHYAVDEAFHPSSFFEENTGMIKQMMAEYPFECFPRRRYAVEHVLLEIVLDRAILRQAEEVCHSLYSMLDRVLLEPMAELMAANTDETDPAAVARHFDRFRMERFIYDYTDDHRLVGLLGHINSRLGNPAMTAGDKEHLKALIYATENALLQQKFPKFRTES